MILILLLIAAVTTKAPFVDIDTVQRVTSELEINLILNENRNLLVMIATNFPTEEVRNEPLQNLLEDSFQKQPNITIGIFADCTRFEYNMKGITGFCRNNTQTKTLMAVFVPRTVSFELKGHHILGEHQNTYLEGSMEADILAKKLRELIPNFVVQIEDTYDHRQFLNDKTMTKLIYFEELLLNPHYLQKISARFYRRVDVGISDNKEIAKIYNVSFPSLVLLQYNYAKGQYQSTVYQGTTNFEDYPFNQVYAFVERHVLPLKSRDLLLDFQLTVQTYTNISSEKLLQKLLKQQKMVIAEINQKHNCDKLKKAMDKFGVMFSYVCFNPLHSSFKRVKQETLILFSTGNLTQFQQIGLNTKIESILSFGQLLHKVSSEREADLCVANAQANDKFAIYSYYPPKTQNDFLIRYLNSLPGVNSLFTICQVLMPDKFVVKKLGLVTNSIRALIPQNDKEGGFKTVQHNNIQSFLDLKMFLRDIAINKLTILYQDKLKRQVENVNTPEQLNNNCFSKPCIIGLLNTKKSRSKNQLAMLKSFEIQFHKIFNIVWIDAVQHKELLSQLKLKEQQLSVLLYYHDKSSKYLVYDGGKYWIKKDIKKWIKGIRAGKKLNKLKFSLDIESKQNFDL